MSIDFHNPDCQEIAESLVFGLCDDRDNQKAYINTMDSGSWVATVTNSHQKRCLFTAIDHCIISSAELKSKPRCDGMLTTDEHFCFVELKTGRSGWMEEAVIQLSSTIELYKESHGMPLQSKKKAYACNKRYPQFRVYTTEQMRRFFKRHGFRLDINSVIVL